MIWRVHRQQIIDDGVKLSCGFDYFTSRGEAEEWIKEESDLAGDVASDPNFVYLVEGAAMPSNAREVVALLQRWASHPDLGEL